MDHTIHLNHLRTELKKFVSFCDAEWEIFKQYLEFRHYDKKEFFAVPGEICDHMGFILCGAMRYFHVREGIEITGFFSFENELVSAYKSFLTRQPNTNYIQAIEKTTLILISKKNFELMENNPAIAFKIEQFGRRIAEYYICCYEDRVASFIIQSPEERYLDMQKNAGELFLRIPQHYVANFLGITPVSLSRIRKRTLKVHA